MSAASSWSSTQLVAGSSESSSSSRDSSAAAASSGFAARRSTPGVDGLHEREIDVGAPGDERVVATVEEQQDAGAGQPSPRLFEPQVDRDRNAAHVADLEVEDHEIGFDPGERVAHVLAARDLHDFLARADERRPHLVANPLGVGGYEDCGHRVGSLDRNRGADEKPADLPQRGEVVRRHARDRARS